MTSESNPKALLEVREPIYEEYFNSGKVLVNFTDSGTPSNDCSSGYLKQTITAETANTVIVFDTDTEKDVAWRKWGDYVVEFRYMVESGTTCDPFVTGEDDGGTDLFTLEFASSTFTFKDEDGNSIGTHAGVQLNRWYDLKIQQRGTTIEGWVNGTSVGSAATQDSSPPTLLYQLRFGSVASKTITHRIDNLQVYRLKQVHDDTGSSITNLSVNKNIVEATDSFRASLSSDAINPILFVKNEQEDYQVHTVDQSQTTTDTLSKIDAVADRFAQIFKPTKSKLSKIGLKLRKQGTPTGNLKVNLYEVKGDADVPAYFGIKATRSYAVSSIDGDFSEHEISLSWDGLDINRNYAIVVHHDNTGSTPDSTNYIEIGRNSAGGYANGKAKASTDTGMTWSDETGDFYFKTYYPTNSYFDLTVKANVRNILSLELYDEDDNLKFTTGRPT